MFSRRAASPARRTFSQGRRAIWPPTLVPGLLAWWDMQETFAQSGGVMTSIRNMVSAVDWSEVTAPPTYEATGLNGRPCMVGDGATSSRKILSSEAAVLAAFSGAAKALTFICVSQPAVASQIAGLIGAADAALAANSSWRLGMTTTGAGLWSMAKRGTATASLTGTTTVSTSPTVTTYRTDGALADIFVGLNLEASGAFVDVGAPTPTRVGLMCYPTLTIGSFFNGKWGAGLLYSGALSNFAIRGLVRGLNQRWGL